MEIQAMYVPVIEGSELVGVRAEPHLGSGFTRPPVPSPKGQQHLESAQQQRHHQAGGRALVVVHSQVCFLH